MTAVDRAALIEAVERERCAHMVSMADYRRCVCGSEMDARHQSRVIADAVLPLIAAAIEEDLPTGRSTT